MKVAHTQALSKTFADVKASNAWKGRGYATRKQYKALARRWHDATRPRMAKGTVVVEMFEGREVDSFVV